MSTPEEEVTAPETEERERPEMTDVQYVATVELLTARRDAAQAVLTELAETYPEHQKEG